ncbi:CBS domain-containing protein [Chitinophaga jiangningensis]|uniref:CBS domain-containing protein n=1 Tax=Chitinophaga jiangningensis TaxID=1419482 RepID=A0A1M7KY47_9BACT|nr:MULTISPECIES: CBS domain-containing protein [Chitinophaga]MBV7531517.1 CBS domain-containing protein [Chitinophaga sp. sic0106]SHM70312.1 CBS domain-containing protein [Chitinophaga jiangningensis]
MGTVRNILEAKGHAVYAIRPDNTVYEGIQMLVDRNVGALTVVDENDHCLGIFSERDYARRVILKGRASKDTLISEIMTADPYTVTVESSIEDCMVKMTDKHIRHLPVVNDQNQLIGIISIGDVVKYIINDQKHIISNLELYINGSHG